MDFEKMNNFKEQLSQFFNKNERQSIKFDNVLVGINAIIHADLYEISDFNEEKGSLATGVDDLASMYNIYKGYD
jgi:hypothetical protein